LRTTARRNIAHMICNAYATFYNAVTDPHNGYENPQAIFKHTPDQVRSLIEV